VDFDANMRASMKVASLLAVPADRRPGPGQPDRSARRRGAAAAHQSTRSSRATTPGYVSYTQVTRAERRQLSGVVNAFAEALSGMLTKVS
jgi:iron uptake system EfeUOB component EfeO/EfeM